MLNDWRIQARRNRRPQEERYWRDYRAGLESPGRYPRDYRDRDPRDYTGRYDYRDRRGEAYPGDSGYQRDFGDQRDYRYYER
jgi:hypothetical protein